MSGEQLRCFWCKRFVHDGQVCHACVRRMGDGALIGGLIAASNLAERLERAVFGTEPRSVEGAS